MELEHGIRFPISFMCGTKNWNWDSSSFILKTETTGSSKVKDSPPSSPPLIGSGGWRINHPMNKTKFLDLLYIVYDIS
jgi:hypothetical protein